MNQRFYRCYLLQTLGPLQLIKSHKEDELIDNNLTRNTILDYLASLQRAAIPSAVPPVAKLTTKLRKQLLILQKRNDIDKDDSLLGKIFIKLQMLFHANLLSRLMGFQPICSDTGIGYQLHLEAGSTLHRLPNDAHHLLLFRA